MPDITRKGHQHRYGCLPERNSNILTTIIYKNVSQIKTKSKLYVPSTQAYVYTCLIMSNLRFALGDNRNRTPVYSEHKSWSQEG